MIKHPDPAPIACFRIPAARLGCYLALIALTFVLISCNALPDISWLSHFSTRSTVATTTPPISSPSPTNQINFADFSTPSSPTQPVTRTSSPQTLKPIDTPTPTPLPKVTSDLLYLSNDRLMRWDHVTNFMVPLIEGVSDYSASQDVHWITLLKPAGVTANGVALYNLDLLDMDTKQTTNLLKGIPHIDEMLISPDGHWIVYQEAREEDSELIALSLRQPDQPKQLGTCTPLEGSFCKTVVWSPASNAILWKDSRGLWLSSLDKDRTSLLTPYKIEVLDPKGKKSLLAVAMQGLSFAPSGRYLLSEISTAAGVCWIAVLDVYQIRWNEVQDTFVNSCPLHASASWTDQGDLVIVKPFIKPAGLYPIVDTWQILPTKNGLFDLLQEIELNSLQIEAVGNQATEMDYSILWPRQINKQTVGFGLLFAGSSARTDVYLANLDSGQINLLARIPEKVSSVHWAPDGSGALVIKDNGAALFASLSEKTPIDLTASSNGEARKFIWTPPTPRS